jgi:hypothetical protein
MSKDWENYDFLAKTDAEIAIWLKNTSQALEHANKSRAVAAQSLLPFLTAETERRSQHEQSSSIKTVRSKTTSSRNLLEQHYATRLRDFVITLETEYDLTAETAQKLSINFKGFRARNARRTSGEVMIGGARIAGIAAIYRYTAYRIRDMIVSFSIVLEKAAPEENIKFIIAAPADFLSNPHPIPTLRSTTPAETSSLKNEMGMSFSDFDEAAELYKTIIQKIAPSRSLLA